MTWDLVGLIYSGLIIAVGVVAALIYLLERNQ